MPPGEEQRAPGGDGADQRGPPQEEHPGRGIPEGGGQASGQRGEGVRVADACFPRRLRPRHAPGEVRVLSYFCSRLYAQPRYTRDEMIRLSLGMVEEAICLGYFGAELG